MSKKKLDPLNHPNADLEADVAIVFWDDANSQGGWTHEDSGFEQISNARVASAGFLVHEDDQAVFLQQSHMMYPDGSYARGDLIKIPRGMISQVVTVKSVNIRVLPQEATSA